MDIGKIYNEYYGESHEAALQAVFEAGVRSAGGVAKELAVTPDEFVEIEELKEASTINGAHTIEPSVDPDSEDEE